MSILDILGPGKTKRPRPRPIAETEAVRNIVEVLGRLEPGQARYLAAFAYILSRVARADLDISEDEKRVMGRAIVERGGLVREQARLVVEMANQQSSLFGGIEDFPVTREFNKIATRKEKMALLVGDSLHACIDAEGAGQPRGRRHVPRGIAQPLGPPDGPGIEHPIALRAGKHHRRELASGRRAAAEGIQLRGGDHFQTRQIGGIAVIFPSDQAGDGVPVARAGALEDPVGGLEENHNKTSGAAYRTNRSPACWPT